MYTRTRWCQAHRRLAVVCSPLSACRGLDSASPLLLPSYCGCECLSRQRKSPHDTARLAQQSAIGARSVVPPAWVYRSAARPLDWRRLPPTPSRRISARDRLPACSSRRVDSTRLTKHIHAAKTCRLQLHTPPLFFPSVRPSSPMLRPRALPVRSVISFHRVSCMQTCGARISAPRESACPWPPPRLFLRASSTTPPPPAPFTRFHVSHASCEPVGGNDITSAARGGAATARTTASLALGVAPFRRCAILVGLVARAIAALA